MLYRPFPALAWETLLQGHRDGQAQDTQHRKAETDSCIFNTEAQSLGRGTGYITQATGSCAWEQREEPGLTGAGSVGSMRSGTPGSHRRMWLVCLHKLMGRQESKATSPGWARTRPGSLHNKGLSRVPCLLDLSKDEARRWDSRSPGFPRCQDST